MLPYLMLLTHLQLIVFVLNQTFIFSVDQEEPPVIEDVDTNFESFYQQLHQDEDDQYYYEPEHAITCSNTLQKAFKVSSIPWYRY